MNKKFITIVILFYILPFKVFSQDIDDEIVTDTLTLEESDMYDHFLQIDYALRDTSERTMPIFRLPPASTTPFSHSKVYTTNNGNITSCILIIVSNDICEYSSLLNRIIRYANDLYYALKKDVIIEKVVAEDYTDIKQLIRGYYYNNGLIGVTLIGNINYASYHQVYKVWNDNLKKRVSKAETWPCDLYYMDMDGDWIDTNGDRIFDEHKGKVRPEIFVGRIPISNDSLDYSYLIDYLNKNHDYWLGKLPIREGDGLLYVNKDWVNRPSHFGIEKLYGDDNYTLCQWGSAGFGPSAYLGMIKTDAYEFVQLAAHSNPQTHYFQNNLPLTAEEIFNSTPSAIGYNLFCCSACNWVQDGSRAKPVIYSSGDFLGGAYIFNQGNGLAVVGSAKTGSMLRFKYFYKPLGEGKTIGNSLLQWWRKYCGICHTQYEIHWFYGLTIIGDPFVSMTYNTNNTCQDVLRLNEFDNSSPSKLHYYRAKQCIEVGNNYVIPAGKYVIFDAPEIRLLPGFQCSAGAHFETYSDGCNCNHTIRAHSNIPSQRVKREDDNATIKSDCWIYPNPSDGFINVVVQDNISSVRIYDLSGQCILQSYASEIDVSYFSQGMYVIHCTTQSGKIYQQTFIKL